MWNNNKLNKNYLIKMLSKQVEIKEQKVSEARIENLQKYLGDIREQPSAKKEWRYGSRAWKTKK